jgi:DNA-binding beta-propeller fold protein YncE
LSSSGSTPNKLSNPAGLIYDEANQDLYIANSGSTGATVIKWRVGASNGTFIAGISGNAGSNSSQLSSPMGIALDQWHNLYVADRTNNRVQFFCNGSSIGITIAGAGTGGSTLSAPYDVKLDSQLNLYVSENSGARVRKFTKL